MSESNPDPEKAEHQKELAEEAKEGADEMPGEEMVPEQGQQIMNFLGNGGIKRALLAENYEDPETGASYSQAHIIADVINVMRMDAKQMAALHDIDATAEKMTPERAASLIQDMATGDDITALLTVFQEIEDTMDLVFQQRMERDTYERYDHFKEQMLYTTPEEEHER